jgi:hypothetical protein
MDERTKRAAIERAAKTGTCPQCHRPVAGVEVGSGSRRDGVFCSQDCQATFHADYYRARAEHSRRSPN